MASSICAMEDVFANKIVGYSIDSRMKSSVDFSALDNAGALRGDVAGCVVHSDRGSQFRSGKCLRALARHRMVGSLGRVDSCSVNTAMEPFFSVLHKNVFNRRSSCNAREAAHRDRDLDRTHLSPTPISDAYPPRLSPTPISDAAGKHAWAV